MKAFLFDNETTDLIRNRHRPLPQQPHVTELFGLMLEIKLPMGTAAKKPNGKSMKKPPAWKEVGTFSSLFNPGIPLSAEVQRITGLNDEMLKDQPPFAKHAKEIKALIESADMAVAHNLSFDKAMLDIEMARLNLSIKWPARMVCTVEASEHLLGRRLKLIELHQHLFGIPFEGAHRAENDVRPMAKCFIELYARGFV